ncbi:hypothetical protein EDB85DRAFT_1999651 [Lactarius pseudohatsudake]|nr:hypothetical protein EDB85DRAFT_1999651 [Lactarius pseudohatsudake]
MMDDQWTIPTDSNPHKDPQGHHVVQAYARFPRSQVPPARPDPNFQPNTPTPAQGTYDTVPNCSCQRCSDAQRRQPTWYPIEQQDRQNAVAPYVNQDQGVNNHVETALIAPVRSQAQFAPPQAAEIQVPERAGPFDMGLVPAPILNASIVEGRRRLAGHYINNPDAYVSVIRLEPGQSGRFQVIIVLEMPNIL